MSSTDRRSRRREKLRRKQEYKERVAEAQRLPQIEVVAGQAPPRLVEAVKAAVKELVFNHASLLPPQLCGLLRSIKRYGYSLTAAKISRIAPSPGRAQILIEDSLNTLGQLVVERIPRSLVEAYLPYHFPRLEAGWAGERVVRINIRSLLTARSAGGTVYYSPREPAVRVDGRERVVSFSDHAMRRIWERTVGDWRTFGGGGDAFAFIHDCVYFEDCTAAFGEPCFTFYNSCAEGYFSILYAQEVLGEPVTDKKHYYRVGYCPAVLEGRFAKAKTLLLPGMRGTPEYKVIMRSDLSTASKLAMVEGADRLTWSALGASRDFSLVRWFHDHEVPQVVRIEREVFRYE